MFATKPAAPGPDIVLSSTKVEDISAQISKAIAGIKSTKKVLIIDQMDALLAVGGDNVDALRLQNMTLALREVCSNQTITPSTDTNKYTKLECIFHSYYASSRLAAHPGTSNNPRARACFTGPRHGTRRRRGALFEEARYWSGRRCQRGDENIVVCRRQKKRCERGGVISRIGRWQRKSL